LQEQGCRNKVAGTRLQEQGCSIEVAGTRLQKKGGLIKPPFFSVGSNLRASSARLITADSGIELDRRAAVSGMG
jgi:hypothetical protein